MTDPEPLRPTSLPGFSSTLPETLGRRLHYATVYKLRADQSPLILSE